MSPLIKACHWAGVLLLCTAAHAQEVPSPEATADDATVLEPVTATSVKLSSPTSLSSQDARERIEQTPGGVAVVPREIFEDRYAVNIRDMLGATPGVFAQTRFAEEVRLSIRGSGLGRSNHLRGILLLQDGVPVNLPDGFGDFQEIDPNSVAYAEVYKGGNGLRYGSAALGGAINFAMPSGHTAAQRNLLRLEGGSFGSLREQIAVARANERWDFYASATANQADGFRDQSKTNNKRFNGNFGYALGDGAETRFYLNFNDIDQQIPGTISFTAALNDPQSVLPTAVSFDTGRDIDSVRLANKTRFQLGGGQMEAGGYLFRKKLFHPITNIVIDQDGDFYGAFAQWNTEGMLAQRRNELTLGSRIGAGDNNARVFMNMAGQSGNQTANADERAREYNLYAENRWWLTPALALIGGAQVVRAERDYTDNVNAAESAQRSYRGYSPKLGVLWTPQEKTQVFGNVSRSYEPPIFGDLNQNSAVGACAGIGAGGFAPLDAQKAWTAEFGTRGSRGVLVWDVVVYRAEIQDEILQRACSPTVAIQFNTEDTIHQGIEAGLAWRMFEGLAREGDKLTLQQAYTYAHFNFDGDAVFGSNQLAGQPEHYWQGELRYEHPAGFHVQLGVERSMSSLPVDYANTTRAPGYTVYNVGAGVDLPRGVSLFLEARNLSDERYVSSVSATTDFSTATNQNLFYPGEGRAVFGGMRWAF